MRNPNFGQGPPPPKKKGRGKEICEKNYPKPGEMAWVIVLSSRGVIVIVNGHGDTSSNPRRD